MTRETLARLLVITIAGTPPAAIVALRFLAPTGGDTPTVELTARMPDAGGWAPEVVSVPARTPIRFRLTSDDVVHGFAVGHLDGDTVDVLPGRPSETTITFAEPGTYVYYCTRWCGPDHWRMRGRIEVRDSLEPPAREATVPPPLYVQLGLDLDAAHPASVTPGGRPSGSQGEQWLSMLPPRYRTVAYVRRHAPAGAWTALRQEDRLREVPDEGLWDVVAALWHNASDPVRVDAGRQLYAANCAACHGVTGRGDGVMVRALARDSAAAPTHGPRTPADLTDARAMLGVSGALLHGKIQRGGMGTGMPNWGPILTDDQAWTLVEYLWTLQSSGGGAAGLDAARGALRPAR